MSSDSELLSFFKALADANRLRILGLLAGRAHSVEELAAALDLGSSTVSHHVTKLVGSGLVTGRADGHYHVYALDEEALASKAKRMLARESLAGAAVEVDADAFDRKVLAAFVGPDGRFKSLPMQRRKFEVLLRHVLRSLEPGGTWSERELNERLRAFSDDVASLRRGLIDTRLMARDPAGARYRRADAPEPAPADAAASAR